MFDVREAGVGKTLEEVRESIFGTSKASKAFRSIANAYKKYEPHDPALEPLASRVVADMAGSQELKTRLSAISTGVFIQWRNIQDPVLFIQSNAYMLNDLKKWMDMELGAPTPRLSKSTSEFIHEWVNTNIRQTPTPMGDNVHELKRFRPDKTRIYFRGIRFNDIGEMVQFHRTFGSTSKPFPFMSDRYSSWTRSMKVAERFGRYRADSSHNQAMFGWLSRARSNKDYSGYGGYVIGARVSPDMCLVDLAHPDIPYRGGQHGNEGEVIVLPKVSLVCKVYATYGDVEQEVMNYKGKIPGQDYFFDYLGPLQVSEITGDEVSGTVTFTLDMRLAYGVNLGSTPKQVADNPKSKIGVIIQFRKQLYEARWVDEWTISYQKMTA